MELLGLVAVGIVVGVTTVLFGFGGGFVTVPVVAVVETAAGAGGDAIRVAVATSLLVMLVNAAVATAATRRDVLGRLRGSAALLVLLAAGGAVGAVLARSAPEAVLRWGFVAYVALTVADLLVRPGFVHHPAALEDASGARTPTLRAALGLPVGAVASFLGVGGSVMTVPIMRRAGATMPVATALANPLTVAIVAPAAAVTMLVREQLPHLPGLVGAVDVGAAAALLAGAMPVIVVLRRRPPRIPATVHAYGYVALLAAAAVSVAVVR